MVKYFTWIPLLFCTTLMTAQTWVDSLDHSLREFHLPTAKYFWIWQNAPVLHAMEYQYNCVEDEEKATYFDYIRKAMVKNLLIANGAFPNATASGMGMAFLYNHGDEELFEIISNRIYYEYKNSARTSNGAISHLKWTPELWDDTIYMIGMYLIGMYNATGDEKYLDEIAEQIKLHKEKLLDVPSGLWVHGWDDNNSYTLDFCSQSDWADPVTRRSSEVWGRGNGWVVVTISELLKVLPENHPERPFIESSLIEMIQNLPDLQDSETGHWFQLPLYPNESGNYIESSSTAMFAYGILTALELGIVNGPGYERAVKDAYTGLRKHSIFKENFKGIIHYNIKNVAQETCLGDKSYYYNIDSGEGNPYALAIALLFGRAFEKSYLNGNISTGIFSQVYELEMKIYPNLLRAKRVNLRIDVSSVKPYYTHLQIIDLNGRVVKRREEHLNTGNNRINWNIAYLSPGQYFLLLENDIGQYLAGNKIMVQE